MSKKPIIRAAQFLFLGFVAFFLWSALSLFIPRHGTVGSYAALRKVYGKAGPRIAVVFTNSLTEKFPFDGPIDWRLVLIKDPVLTLSGNVNTNALPAFIKANSGTEFIWSGTDVNRHNWLAEEWPTAAEYPSVHWEKLAFRAGRTNGSTTAIDCTLDLASNRVEFMIY